MTVTACSMPESSELFCRKQDCYFTDSFKGPLSQHTHSIHALYYGVFGHMPGWVKTLLLARNKLVGFWGLKGASTEQIAALEFKPPYKVGDHICSWEIYAQSDAELITGMDDKHLDFRVSLFREGETLILTTVVDTHNAFGRAYLAVILPFHKLIVRTMLANAVKAGRV